MFDTNEILLQKEKDKEDLKAYWDRLEYEVKEKSNEVAAKAVRAAFEDYYDAIFGSGDLVSWFGNLYDYESGGFYYSNSARDNEGFLPDLESTRQALNCIHILGDPKSFGSKIAEVYPTWLGERIVKFVKERQNENGYFYHPQWEKEFTDSKPHRRGRDLTWACQILDWYGKSPTYDTPNGVMGDGILADGTHAKDFSHRKEEKVFAPDEKLVTPHLKDKDAFLAYLDTFDLNGKPYVVASRFESEGPQIYARDKVLHAMGADYSLSDILADWFARHQNPTTGLFNPGEPNCEGVNGLLKACGAFNAIKRPFPNPINGIKSAIAVINGNEDVSSVCDVLNPWYALTQILSNVKNYGEDSTETDKYLLYIFEHAPEMMRATKNRIMLFRKPDGSFSFSKDHSSATSQGHPVAVLNTNEGDVNATNISTQGLIGHVFTLLGITRIPVLMQSDKMRLHNILEEKRDSFTF